MGKGKGKGKGLGMEIRMGKGKGMGIWNVPMALWLDLLITCVVTCSIPRSVPSARWHPAALRQGCGWEHQALWKSPSSSSSWSDFRTFCLSWSPPR